MNFDNLERKKSWLDSGQPSTAKPHPITQKIFSMQR